ncbi:hypothetical protein V1478_014014 [Vespula squamosa]|uniref:Uncharacterized protein n=1 Tax=Vespula squamosa TaxID=30214 RepID=A0ABD2A6S8_VESSQ
MNKYQNSLLPYCRSIFHHLMQDALYNNNDLKLDHRGMNSSAVGWLVDEYSIYRRGSDLSSRVSVHHRGIRFLQGRLWNLSSPYAEKERLFFRTLFRYT